jgi:hypothetical protein
VPGPLDPDIAIKDQAQVRAVVEWLSALDAASELGALFGRPENLTSEEHRACVEEEGWIIGGAGVSATPATRHGVSR